jgi:transcriptional regulator with XRE-family HTH domain
VSDRTNRRFADEVSRLLKDRGMSATALAERAGLSQSHLSRLLRHADYKKTPSRVLTRSVARALDLPDDYFREYREAYVVEQIHKSARVSDELYDLLRQRRQHR